MCYSFARVSAALGMKVEDYYPQGKRWWSSKTAAPSTLASHTASLNNRILAFLAANVPTSRRHVFHSS